MKVCVLGLGYIGLPTASLLAVNGHEVLGVDINKEIVDKINDKISPFKEPGLDKLLKNTGGHLIADNEVKNSGMYLIAVPTPLEKAMRVADLKSVRLAAEMIYPHLKPNDLVILESTVPPGTSERLLIPVLEKSGLSIGEFGFAHCPERAIPGRTLFEMINNARIIGANTQTYGELAKTIYSSFVRGDMYLTDVRTAEFVKLMENTYRDINIALANEFAQIGEDCGINTWEAIDLANKHPRVSILKPGPGVGGHCIAIDPWFLTESSINCRMVSLAREINDSMPNYVVKMMQNQLLTVKDPIVTLFGVAYKGNIDDVRESPAFKLIKLAENEGYVIKCYDPLISDFAYGLNDLEKAVESSDCIIVLADHDAFKNIDPAKIKMRTKNLIDTRNILDHERWRQAGFRVRILGNTI